ncbi:MAG: alpha/beta hydrolase, partial [Mycobacterium sp.]
DFRGARGRIALVLTAIAWALLYLIHRRNVASEPHFEEPLRKALGDDYEQIAAQSQPARRRRTRIGVWPTELVRRRYVEKTSTVQYGPHRRVNRADIWRRADLPRDGKAPVLLQVPGGAWAIGMRRPQSYALLSHMAERGWVCLSIDYRVSPKNTWPDHIVDVKRALAWIKENIADYGGDPNFVAITGGSAGGHLSSLAALTPNDPQWQPGFEDVDTSVAAAVPIYGRYDWLTATGSGRKEFIGFLQKFVVKKPFAQNRQTYLDASSIKRLRPNAPPFFILHGQDDSIIPVGEGREFADALREVSTSTVAYAQIPHAQHAFDFYYGSPRAHYTARAVEEFLSWVHAKREAKAEPTKAP